MSIRGQSQWEARMSAVKVLSYIDVAAVPSGDRERSIEVIDDLLPLEATFVKLVTPESSKVTAALFLRVSQ